MRIQTRFVILFSLACTAIFLIHDATAEQPSADQPRRSSLKLGEMLPVDQAIDLFAKRMEGKPNDVANRVALGRLYLRKARDQDDFASYGMAESILNQALKNNGNYTPAKTYLAKALMARHQFEAALELGLDVLQSKPNNAVAWSIVGDCQLELGRYQDAETSYQELLKRERSAATIARQSHLQELLGNDGQSRKLIDEARRIAEEAGLPDDQVAWFELRQGTLAQKQGRLKEAVTHFQTALSLREDYAPAMAALAQTYALQNDTDKAISLYRSAIDIHGEPPMMWGLGDIYHSIGDEAQAEEWYEKTEAAMSKEALTAAAAHYREVARFYCDTDRNLARALDLARQDHSLRQDIYSYDLLAWAQFKNGMFSEAAENIDRAMKQGTRDATIAYHAGLIRESLDDPSGAVKWLSEALAMNPTFSVTLASDARKRLQRLQRVTAHHATPVERHVLEQ